MAIQLIWGNCTNDVWCDFINLNLEHEIFNDLKGVYIIWSGEIPVRLGSGIIKDRIYDHRNNQEILDFADLKVTWAEVSENSMENVEKYLANVLQPEVGERFPDKQPIEVNLPWN